MAISFVKRIRPSWAKVTLSIEGFVSAWMIIDAQDEEMESLLQLEYIIDSVTSCAPWKISYNLSTIGQIIHDKNT